MADRSSTGSMEVPDPAIGQTPAPNSALRVALLLLTAGQMTFIIGLTVFITRHMNPRGGGMEFAAVSAAVMLLEIPLAIPAFVLAVRGKALGIAACLAGFATFAYVIFGIQVYAEVTAKSAI